MNDDTTTAAATSDPFSQIQNSEGSAEKDIETKSQKNSEALASAKLEKEAALKAYEDELKSEGMGQLREVKAKAMEKMDGELKAANSEAQTLKNSATTRMDDAVNVILETFKSKVK